MLDARAYLPLKAKVPPPLPVADMMRDLDVGEAALLLPRVFNLCREAQGLAARAAFGLPLSEGWQEALRQEILRAHVAKLALQWPALLGCPPLSLPADWTTNTDALRATLFGPARRMPATPAAFGRFLVAHDGVAVVLCALGELFAPGEAVRDVLPATTPSTIFAPDLQDNSIAARHADHPILRCIEDKRGRGPLWAATALCIDLEEVLTGTLPEMWTAEGQAVVPAARGLYGIQARVRDGKVTAFHRVTPTDHMLTKDGVMDQCLRTLPASDAATLGPILLAVLDPCVPITLVPMEAAHA